MVSPKTRKKMSASAKKRDPATRIRSPETRQRISVSLKGKSKSASHRGKISLSKRGIPLSPETRIKLGISQRDRFKNPLERAKIGRPGRIVSEATKRLLAIRRAEWLSKWPKPETQLEKSLYRMLCFAGFLFERQKRFGRYVVDAFVPALSLAFEADGAYWHQDLQREKCRDSYLIGRGIFAVIHLSEEDLL